MICLVVEKVVLIGNIKSRHFRKNSVEYVNNNTFMMKKETLIRFIDKYSLGDNIKAVNWKIVAADKQLKARGEMDSKTFTMDVTMNGFEEIKEDVRIPIAATHKVRSMLSPFEEDISLTLNKPADRVLGFAITSEGCESYCTAADPSAIPPVTKDITDKHLYDVEVALTDEFVDRFLKSKSALDEVNEFTIRMNKKDQVEFVLGFSVTNTNRITLVAPTINGKDKFDGQPIKFISKYFVEVLKANKEIPDGVLYFKSNGIVKIVYKSDEFQCLYWQLAQIKN
jgi:hypothetical protein